MHEIVFEIHDFSTYNILEKKFGDVTHLICKITPPMLIKNYSSRTKYSPGSRQFAVEEN
jgi:hypothetical protein